MFLIAWVDGAAAAAAGPARTLATGRAMALPPAPARAPKTAFGATGWSLPAALTPPTVAPVAEA